MIREEPRPGEIAQGKSNSSKEDDLIQFGSDGIRSRDRPLAPAIQRIPLYPIHKEVAQDSKNRDNGLQRDKEADKDEVVDDIDVLQPNLKLHSLANLVQLELVDE